jgi:predicted HicB family RNase H-like nuclease
MMQYKEYIANVVFDDENDLFHGEVLGIRDVVTFQGRSTKEPRKAFKDSVDDYIEFCMERGETPDKPVSARFVLRIPPELHRELCKEANKSNQSLNTWITTKLENAVYGVLTRNQKSKPTPSTKQRGAVLHTKLKNKKRQSPHL